MKVYREITPLREPDVFVVLDSYNNGFDYPLHNHPEYELNLVLGSSGTRIVGDSTETYDNQDLALIGPYLYHKWDNERSKGLDHDNSRVITIQFRMDSFNSLFFQKSQFRKIRELLNNVSRGLKFHGRTLAQASHMMDTLTVEKGFPTIITFLQLLDLLSGSKECTYLASEGYSTQAIPSKSNRIQRATGYILKHYNKSNLKISELAEHLNMSVSAFSHFFKKNTNKSYSQFLIDVRISHACQMLLDTDQNIKQICYAAGFNNLANFNRLFKKYRLCTPFDFRRRLLTNDSFDWTTQNTPWQFVPTDANVEESFKPSKYTTRVTHV